MHIAYCSNVRLPSERAHGHQVAQVCDALMRLGHDVTVMAPYRKNVVQEDYWTYYDANRSVKLMHVGRFDPINHQLFPGISALWILNFLLRWNMLRFLRTHTFDIVYTRSAALLPALLRMGPPVVLELHGLLRWGRRRFVRRCNRCRLVVCLTSPMRDALVSWGVDAKRVIVEGDAVDLRRFASMPEKESARMHWQLPSNERMIVGYVGRLKTLGMEKGVADLLQALVALRSTGRFFGFIVGGPETDRLQYERMATDLGLTSEDVRFTGAIPAQDIHSALAACDVLTMPFPDLPHYRFNMSPLKMFEYMAARRPIVTSDLPTVRDVLSEETAVFCEPGNPSSIANALQWIADHPEQAAQRAAQARHLVERHTWEERMRRILNAATLPA